MDKITQPAIVTVYGKDGSKTRKVVGIPGGACHVAAAPYEAREIPGQMRKTPTSEACMEPDTQRVRIDSVTLGEQ